MDTHEELASWVERYEDLSPEDRARFDRHTAECAICAARLAIRQYGVRQTGAATTGLASTARRLRPIQAWLALGLLALVVILAVAARPAVALRLPFAPAPRATAVVALRATPPMPTARLSSVPSPTVFPLDAVTWLRNHAEPLPNVEPGATEADLAPLARAVSGRRVLIVNDSGFGGTHEMLALQQRLLELLAARQGTRVMTLVMEAPWPEAAAVERYVQQDAGQPEDLTLSPGGPGVATQESAYTLRWLRAHYPGVHVVGYLPATGDSQLALQIVNDYFLAVDPESLSETGGDKRRLIERLAARRDNYVGQYSVELYNTARQAAQILLESEQLAAARNPSEYAALYDQFALANLQRLLPTLAPGPVLVWREGSVWPASKARRDVITYLRAYYGEQAMVIGMAYYAGSNLQRWDSAGILHTVPPGPPGSWEGYFHEAGLPAFTLDLVQGREAPLPGWLKEAHPARTLPLGPDDCHPELAFESLAMGTRADLVVFFDRARPSAPLGKLPTLTVGCAPATPGISAPGTETLR